MRAKERLRCAAKKKPTQGHVQRNPWLSHGRDRDDGFRNPPVAEAIPHRSAAEARRRPPRVRSLMEIVGSNEQMACVGFYREPITAGVRSKERYDRTKVRA